MKILLVSRKEIANCDIELIYNAFLEEVRVFIRTRDFTPLSFRVSGYDADTRALFDIPEVRNWATELYRRMPVIFSVVAPGTLHWLFAAVAEIEITERTSTQTNYTFLPDAKKKLLEAMFAAQNELFQKLAATQQEFDRISDAAHQRILNALV
jgi:hypothetical protein